MCILLLSTLRPFEWSSFSAFLILSGFLGIAGWGVTRLYRLPTDLRTWVAVTLFVGFHLDTLPAAPLVCACSLLSAAVGRWTDFEMHGRWSLRGLAALTVVLDLLWRAVGLWSAPPLWQAMEWISEGHRLPLRPDFT